MADPLWPIFACCPAPQCVRAVGGWVSDRSPGRSVATIVVGVRSRRAPSAEAEGPAPALSVRAVLGNFVGDGTYVDDPPSLLLVLGGRLAVATGGRRRRMFGNVLHSARSTIVIPYGLPAECSFYFH